MAMIVPMTGIKPWSRGSPSPARPGCPNGIGAIFAGRCGAKFAPSAELPAARICFRRVPLAMDLGESHTRNLARWPDGCAILYRKRFLRRRRSRGNDGWCGGHDPTKRRRFQVVRPVARAWRENRAAGLQARQTFRRSRRPAGTVACDPLPTLGLDGQGHLPAINLEHYRNHLERP